MLGARHIFKTEGNLFDSLSNGAVASVVVRKASIPKSSMKNHEQSFSNIVFTLSRNQMIVISNPQLTTPNPPALLAGPGWNGRHQNRRRRGASGGGASEGRASEGGAHRGVVLRVCRTSDMSG